jgi:hypothetical protein
MWLCDCDCGGRHRAETHSLTSGRTTNCGCVKLEKWKKRISLPFGLASKRAVFARYKKNAERKGQEFDLVFEEFIDLCSQSCSYCGDPPSNEQKSGYKNGDFIYVGLDRVDNSLGYTKDNVVPCCTLCNKGKREMSKENFLAWVKRISDYNHFTDGGA